MLIEGHGYFHIYITTVIKKKPLILSKDTEDTLSDIEDTLSDPKVCTEST